MKFLVDTQILVWQFVADRRLTKALLDLLCDETNRILFSDISCWEIAIKHRSGKLPLTLNLFERECIANRYERLPIRIGHIRELDRLELIHGDPFDRLLISQAIAEGLSILTADKIFSRYPVGLIGT